MFDLTGPWIEKPVVNWAAMPAWANYVARDNNGKWYHYENEPLAEDGQFTNRSGWSAEIPSGYWPTYTGDWRNSKVQRPQA